MENAPANRGSDGSACGENALADRGSDGQLVVRMLFVENAPADRGSDGSAGGENASRGECTGRPR